MPYVQAKVENNSAETLSNASRGRYAREYWLPVTINWVIPREISLILVKRVIIREIAKINRKFERKGVQKITNRKPY